jgi:hypothetical protein
MDDPFNVFTIQDISPSELQRNTHASTESSDHPVERTESTRLITKTINPVFNKVEYSCLNWRNTDPVIRYWVRGVDDSGNVYGSHLNRFVKCRWIKAIRLTLTF